MDPWTVFLQGATTGCCANVPAGPLSVPVARRRRALGRSREQTHARARTCRVRAATWVCGNGEAAIERLHDLIPSKVVPWNQEVTAVEAGQQFRVINNALFGVEALWGSHGHLFASVLNHAGRV